MTDNLAADELTMPSSPGEGAHARVNLPIPEREKVGLTTYDAKDPDTSCPPIEPLLPPAGVPNVLVVLIDDTGFGGRAPSAG